MNKIREQQKPWIDDDGNPFTKEELKEICQNWTPTDWEEYLQSLESGRYESLHNEPEDEEAISDHEYVEIVFSYLNKPNFPKVKMALEIQMKKLSELERYVLRALIVEKKSQFEVAHELKLTRSNVRTIRDRAILKMRKYLMADCLKNVTNKIKAVEKNLNQIEH